MDHITDSLYVGTIDDASTAELLEAAGIETIVSLTHSDLPTGMPDAVAVHNCPMVDGPRNDRTRFETAVTNVTEALTQEETVLVHCSRGVSRSPAVAAVAVALQEEVGIEDAFELVGEQRPACDPHPALVRQSVSVYRACST